MKPGLRLTSFLPVSSSASEFRGSSPLEYPLFSSEASTDKDALFQPNMHASEGSQGKEKKSKLEQHRFHSMWHQNVFFM